MDDEARIELAQRFYEQAFEKQKRGEFLEAEELYKKSIEVYPTAEAYTYLGWTYSLMGRLDDAIEECKKAISVDPTFGNPYNDIGAYLLQKGDVTGAIPWLKRALLAPRYDSYCYPHMNLGRAYLTQHRFLDAATEFRQALEQNPDYAPARKELARLKAMFN
jgi:Tfp pilus assembly protein PilF